MKVKITVKTPKNQAQKCIKSQKKVLLGLSQANKVLDQKVVNDKLFYWIIQVDSEKELNKTITRCSRGEVLIKKFYSTLISLINRANKLANKFQKGVKWVRAWLVKMLKKKGQGELIEQVEQMSDEEIKDFLKITDLEEMRKLLAGSLIEVKVIDAD